MKKLTVFALCLTLLLTFGISTGVMAQDNNPANNAIDETSSVVPDASQAESSDEKRMTDIDQEKAEEDSRDEESEENSEESDEESSDTSEGSKEQSPAVRRGAPAPNRGGDKNANTITPSMTSAEVKNVIKNATGTILVESGTYDFPITFDNQNYDVKLLGDVTINGLVIVKDCNLDGQTYSLTIGSGKNSDGFNVAGKEDVTISNTHITVNSARGNYGTLFSAPTVTITDSSLNSDNNPNGSGLFINGTTKTVTTTNSDLSMCGNGKGTARSGICSDKDGNKNIVFNMTGGSLKLDDNGLNGFQGYPGSWFGAAPRPTFNFHNVNVSASGNGTSQGSGKGDGFSYAYITLTSDTGEHTFDASRNTNNGIDGGRGTNCAFNAKNYTITANNNGNWGIHISKDTSVIENSTVTANDNGNTGFYTQVETTLINSTLTANNNGQQGINASYAVFTAENSTITANQNKRNGLNVSGESMIKGSSVTTNSNRMSGIHTEKSLTIDGRSTLTMKYNSSDNDNEIGAFYVMRGGAVIEEGAKVSITENKRSGAYVVRGAELEIQDGTIDKNGFDENAINAVNGGGVCNKGTFTMGKNVRIYNNHASKMGDDIYSIEGATLTLVDEPDSLGLILDDDNHTIDGWYYDGKGDPDNTKDEVRWNVLPETAAKDLYYHQEKTNLGRTDEVALKAAHGLIQYTVTVQYLEKGTDKVLKEQVVTDPAREGTSYDVNALCQVSIEGYSYADKAGDAWNGTLDSNKIIKLYYEKNTYKVTYVFVSGTENKELPDEVMQLLPKDEQRYTFGSSVTAIQPAQTEVKVTDGVWTFKQYDKEKVENISSDVTFTGVWEFKANEKTNSKPDKPGSTTPANTTKPNTSKADNPKTGDNSGLMRWMALMLVSAAALYTIIRKVVPDRNIGK